MEQMDRDELLLCEMQARTFEQSVERTASSSEIFIRRFMHSRAAKLLDSGAILETSLQPADLLQMIEEQYGVSEYGSVRYTTEEMYWIGYIYRSYACLKNMSSLQVYRIIKPRELRRMFPAYHSMDPAQAVERIMEAKHQPLDEESELQRQYEIFKKHHDYILAERNELPEGLK